MRPAYRIAGGWGRRTLRRVVPARPRRAHAGIRRAGAAETLCLDENLEMLTRSGSVGRGASHLHLSVSRHDGQVLGGHAAHGGVVRTTAEVLLAVLPRWRFTREADAQSGYDELLVRPVAE